MTHDINHTHYSYITIYIFSSPKAFPAGHCRPLSSTDDSARVSGVLACDQLDDQFSVCGVHLHRNDESLRDIKTSSVSGYTFSTCSVHQNMEEIQLHIENQLFNYLLFRGFSEPSTIPSRYCTKACRTCILSM